MNTWLHKNNIIFILFCLLFIDIKTDLVAQTQIKAWYAQGQVWIVWEIKDSLPETFAIYAGPSTFSNINNANIIGRLFKEEYLPGALKYYVDPMATYRIPNGSGGIYQLKNNEGLFVFTPHQKGSLFFAVVPWGQTSILPNQNITQKAIDFNYDPDKDPVECHLQKTYSTEPGFTTFAYYLWADGRQNYWEARPDFPVMANEAKNGMPSMFLVSASNKVDTTNPVPCSIWLNGGECGPGGNVPGGKKIVNINPKEGLLVTHNDDVFGYILSYLAGFEFASHHFGWRKNYDPFSKNNAPNSVDTVVNYTQRKYIWVDEWMIRRLHVDPYRININGHSLGSKGATAIAKTYPDHYASATIFDNGFIEDDPPSGIDILFGPTALHFPTNLYNRNGKNIAYTDVMNITDRNATQRDLPLLRVFHAKNDIDSGSKWDDYVVKQFYDSDSLGWGTQIYWGERAHGIETGPEHNDHWHNGNTPDLQTRVDDISYEEIFLRSNQSFPAFFNHHLDSKNNDPGDGTPGTSPKGVGDDWGCWGGYHRWDANKIIDENDHWSVEAWLESNAVFQNDNCPENSLTADLAVRKPQKFFPFDGRTIEWKVIDLNNGNVLQNGKSQLQADLLVVIPKITVYKENIRKVKILMGYLTGGIHNESNKFYSNIHISSNALNEESWLNILSNTDSNINIKVIQINGKETSFMSTIHVGENRISLRPFEHLPQGIYIIELQNNHIRQSLKWVK